MLIRIEWCYLSLWILHCRADFYNEDSMQVFSAPTSPYSRYFGYSVLLRDNPPRLLVGATNWKRESSVDFSGSVFVCDVNLNGQKENICSPSKNFVIPQKTGPDADYTKSMALGSSLAEVENETLVMCAPRWSHLTNSLDDGVVMRVHGLCFTSPTRQKYLYPLSDPDKQDKLVDGANDTIPYYGYGQAGFSTAVTPDNQWLLLGSPGLLYYTGGLARYSIRHESNNASLVKFDLQEEVVFDGMSRNSYLGYSVDSAVFDPDIGEVLAISGAPRGGDMKGEVFLFTINKEHIRNEDIRIHLNGSQPGEYFGASILAVDINGDGRKDLLVGAPQHASSTVGNCCYDQGVVYVFVNKKTEKGFQLQLANTVTGSEENGARFGSALADLGDVDGDGYSDVAIGAPFEKNGERSGAVYMFRGGANGLRANYSQKLVAKEKRFDGFGFSIAKAIDVDRNGCNDLAIGGVLGNSVATFRCSPKLLVQSLITVEEEAVSSCNGIAIFPIKLNNIRANFCIEVAKPRHEWAHANMNLWSSVQVNKVNLGANRAFEYVTVSRAKQPHQCKMIEIPRKQNEKEITLTFSLGDVFEKKSLETQFDKNRAYLSEDSALKSSLTAYFVDCGPDLKCEPEFHIHHAVLSETYIPGTNSRLGYGITLENRGEPAFGTRLEMIIPKQSVLRKSLGGCTVNDNNFDCKLNNIMREDGPKNWTVELDPSVLIAEGPLNFSYSLYDCEKVVKQSSFVITVELQANITISGRSKPELPLYISRADIDSNKSVKFNHFFDILNYGPSGYPNVTVELEIPSEVVIDLNDAPDCLLQIATQQGTLVRCLYQMRAGLSNARTISLPVALHTKSQETFVYSGKNLTTKATLIYGKLKSTCRVTTQVLAEASSSLPTWVILVSIIAGLLIIATIIYIMYKCGFFVRSKKQKLNELRTQTSLNQDQYRRSLPVSMSNENLMEDECTVPIASERASQLHEDDNS